MSAIDLHVKLHVKGESIYRVEMTLHRPSDAGLTTLVGGEEALVEIDWPAMLARKSDNEVFGAWLGDEVLFSLGPARDAFQTAFGIARDRSLPLRLRLDLGGMPHILPWELLRVDGLGLLATNERILLSRFFPSKDLRSAPAPRPDALAVTVTVANPHGLGSKGLVEPDTERIKADVATILGSLDITTGEATLNGIGASLRDGCDLFYLAAHGAFTRGSRPYLILEDDIGEIQNVLAEKVVEAFSSSLKSLPRLVVLLSCKSGGSGVLWPEGDPKLTLAPKLVEAGVPAVVAMQDNISAESAYRFMQAFFVELMRDGLIDRAMAVARRAIADRHDFWAPVLFMRLSDGRLWVDSTTKKVINQDVATVETQGKVVGVQARSVKSGFELNQRLGTVKGAATGATIETLGKDAEIKINQKADTVSGDLTGAELDEL